MFRNCFTKRKYLLVSMISGSVTACISGRIADTPNNSNKELTAMMISMPNICIFCFRSNMPHNFFIISVYQTSCASIHKQRDFFLYFLPVISSHFSPLIILTLFYTVSGKISCDAVHHCIVICLRSFVVFE